MLFTKYHNVMLCYLKDSMRDIPIGYFGSHRGKDCVYVHKDGAFHKYVLTSSKGREYQPLIENYQRLNSQYKKYTEMWRRTYKYPPKNYDLESIRRNRAGKFNGEFYRQLQPVNCDDAMHPIEYKGLKLRSKNELMAAQILDELGLEFKYEPMVTLNYGKSVLPDFAVYFPAIDLCILVEVYGMADENNYQQNMTEKIKSYTAAGIWPDRDVVHFILPDSKNFDKDAFVTRLFATAENAIYTEDIIQRS